MYDTIADQLTETLVARYSPPIPLNEIAKQLGVASIIKCRMVEEGSATWDPDGRVAIKLRSDRPHARQRFTLAHELGHVILAHPTARQQAKYRLHRLDFDLEERLCNAIAASLLMPLQHMPVCHQSAITPARLQSMARGFDVSLTAMTRRWNGITGHNISLVKVRRRPTGWALTETVAGRARGLALSSETQAAINELRPGAELECTATLTQHGQPRRAHVAITRTSHSTALLLLRSLVRY